MLLFHPIPALCALVCCLILAHSHFLFVSLCLLCPHTSHLIFISLWLPLPVSPSSLFLSLPLILFPRYDPHTHAGTSPFFVHLLRDMGTTPQSPVLSLCSSSQPECPLRLSSAAELLPGRQQQQSQLQCASWIETLPYKALGTVAPANFFFFFAKQASLSAPHLLS